MEIKTHLIFLEITPRKTVWGKKETIQAICELEIASFTAAPFEPLRVLQPSQQHPWGIKGGQRAWWGLEALGGTWEVSGL